MLTFHIPTIKMKQKKNLGIYVPPRKNACTRRKKACPHSVSRIIVKIPPSPPPPTLRGFRCWCFESENSFLWHIGSGNYIQPGESIFLPAVAWSVISQRTLCYAPWQAAEGCVMDAPLSSRKSYAGPVCSGRRKN